MNEMGLEEIKARCDEVGDCWEWRTTTARTDRAKRHPMIGGGVLVRRVAFIAAKGAIYGNRSLVPGCGNPYCINPDHQTQLSYAKKSALGGGYSPTRAASVARTRRAKGLNKLDPQAVREILASEDSGVALARRYGVDEKAIWNVRRGLMHKDHSSPFAGLFSGLLAANDNARRAA